MSRYTWWYAFALVLEHWLDGNSTYGTTAGVAARIVAALIAALVVVLLFSSLSVAWISSLIASADDAEEGGPGTLHRQHSAVLRMLPSFEQGMDVDEDDSAGRRWTKEDDAKLREAVAGVNPHNRDPDSTTEGLIPAHVRSALEDGSRCRV